jgi:hypothetical protein
VICSLECMVGADIKVSRKLIEKKVQEHEDKEE